MNGTKNNAKELDEERQIDQMSVMLLEPLRDLYVDSVVNDERLAKTFSVWPAHSWRSSDRGLCFFSRLGGARRLFWLLFRFVRLT
jgi:hypothetical protein